MLSGMRFIWHGKAQLRRSSWIAIRRKLFPATKRGTYTLQYNRAKLDDFCVKKLLEKECRGNEERYFLRTEIRNKIKRAHLEEVLGENLFMVLGKEECYYNHYSIAKDLDEYRAGTECGAWTAFGWIVTQRGISDMYKEVCE